MFWIVKLFLNFKNLQVNGVSQKTVSDNQEVTLLFWESGETKTEEN